MQAASDEGDDTTPQHGAALYELVSEKIPSGYAGKDGGSKRMPWVVDLLKR